VEGSAVDSGDPQCPNSSAKKRKLVSENNNDIMTKLLSVCETIGSNIKSSSVAGASSSAPAPNINHVDRVLEYLKCIRELRAQLKDNPDMEEEDRQWYINTIKTYQDKITEAGGA
jgi:hypothetical protein